MRALGCLLRDDECDNSGGGGGGMCWMHDKDAAIEMVDWRSVSDTQTRKKSGQGKIGPGMVVQDEGGRDLFRT